MNKDYNIKLSKKDIRSIVYLISKQEKLLKGIKAIKEPKNETEKTVNNNVIWLNELSNLKSDLLKKVL
jgi:hypothetical protein